MNGKVALNVPMTYQELVERNIYLETINRGQTAYIASLEEDYTSAMNYNLKLAKEIDLLTQEVFKSPAVTHNEYVV